MKARRLFSDQYISVCTFTNNIEQKEVTMTDFSKNRVLALYKILTKYTDEQHPISMQDILVYMEFEGHSSSEDSILRYIKQLRNELGVDVISSRGRNARYFIGNRLLEKEEMKLIIDSVNASNFIEKGIAAKMIDKLKSTMSTYDAEELDRRPCRCMKIR